MQSLLELAVLAHWARQAGIWPAMLVAQRVTMCMDGPNTPGFPAGTPCVMRAKRRTSMQEECCHNGGQRCPVSKRCRWSVNVMANNNRWPTWILNKLYRQAKRGMQHGLLCKCAGKLQLLWRAAARIGFGFVSVEIREEMLAGLIKDSRQKTNTGNRSIRREKSGSDAKLSAMQTCK